MPFTHSARYRVTLVNQYLQSEIVVEFECGTRDTLDAALEALQLVPKFNVEETIIIVQQIQTEAVYRFKNGSMLAQTYSKQDAPFGAS